MTNRNLKHAARAYMAKHGVNYTTALRAVLAGDTAPATAAPPSAQQERAPYGHPDYEMPDSMWETLRDLSDAANAVNTTRSARRELFAYDGYLHMRDVLTNEQAKRIPAFLDDLTNRLNPTLSTLLDRAAIDRHARDTLRECFDDYWDDTTTDDGYPAAATLDIAAGVIGWLMASAVRPDRDSHSVTYLNGHQTRAMLHALTETTLDTLDTVNTTHVGYRYDTTRAIVDPDERTVALFTTIGGYPREDITLLLAPTDQ